MKRHERLDCWLLGHASVQTTLRYSSLVGADLQRAHRKAGAIERLHLD
jgi:hypothetical protein